MSTSSGPPSPLPPWRGRCFMGFWPFWNGASPSGTRLIVQERKTVEISTDGRRLMRRMIGAMTVAAAVAGFGAQAEAADALTLQLKWVTQAQFAGYYVAKEKGFY